MWNDKPMMAHKQTYRELVERLRDWSEGPNTSLLTDQAADALEDLLKENKRLKAKLTLLRSGCMD